MDTLTFADAKDGGLTGSLGTDLFDRDDSFTEVNLQFLAKPVR